MELNIELDNISRDHGIDWGDIVHCLPALNTTLVRQSQSYDVYLIIRHHNRCPLK